MDLWAPASFAVGVTVTSNASNAPVLVMPWVPALNQILIFATLVVHPLAILFSAHLLGIGLCPRIFDFRSGCGGPSIHGENTSNQALKMSRSLYLFFGTHVIFGAQCLPYYAYALMWSSPFPPYTLWWLGMPQLAYSALAPYPTVFLVLDRCLTLWSATQFTMSTAARLRTVLLVIGVVVVNTIYLLVMGVNPILEFPLQQSRVVTCTTVACLLVRTGDALMIGTRFGGECCAILASLLFFFTLRFQQGGRRSRNIKTRLVKIMLVSELLLSSIPICISETFATVYQVQVSSYIGNLVPLLVRTDLLVAISAYYWAFFLNRWLRRTPRVRKISVAASQFYNGVTLPQQHNQLRRSISHNPATVSVSD